SRRCGHCWPNCRSVPSGIPAGRSPTSSSTPVASSPTCSTEIAVSSLLMHETGSARRKLGVMGGTFDPVHHGHLVAASEVAHRFELDEVIFVPTGQPWQKAHKTVSPAEDRYLMTVIATASNPRFSVSRADIDR